MVCVVDTGKATAAQNMAQDSALLAQLEKNPQVTLHWYDWAHPCLTYGYFIDPSSYLCLEQLAAKKIDAARRPTGGGLIFHTSDLAFSLLVPAMHPLYSSNTLENYRLVNSCVVRALCRFSPLLQEDTELLQSAPKPQSASSRSFCMAHPTRYDIMIGARKVGGAAQRRKKQGFLHQGSICLTGVDPLLLKAVLLPDPTILQAMQKSSYPLLGQKALQPCKITEARSKLRQFLEQSFSETFT